MGTINKTSTGSHRVRWYDQHGRQHSKSLPTRDQARTFLKHVEGEVSRGTFINPERGRVTVSEWIAECRANDFALEASTRDTERRAEVRLNEAFGHIHLRNLTADHIEVYITDRLDAGAAPGYVAMDYRVLRKWLNRAVKRDRIHKNPCGLVACPKSSIAEMRFLSMEQLVALAEVINPRYRAWVYVMGVVGLRFSEANGLRRARVNGPKMDIVEQMVWDRQDRYWNRKTQLKTKASRRTVTLSTPLITLLEAHIETYALEGPEGHVFPNQRGNPIGQSTFTKGTFKPALIEAGIDPRFRIHDLRHTAVALSVAAGAHPTAIQRRMGHSSITVTLGTYGHLFPELDVDLSDKLGDAMTIAMSNPVGSDDGP